MSHPVSNKLAAALAPSQLMLCPYNEEEPAIWFRLIQAQFSVVGFRSKKILYANTLATLPKQVLRDILDTVGAGNGAKRPFDDLKTVLLGKFGKSK
jgi:hypothetical protein